MNEDSLRLYEYIWRVMTFMGLPAMRYTSGGLDSFLVALAMGVCWCIADYIGDKRTDVQIERERQERLASRIGD